MSARQRSITIGNLTYPYRLRRSRRARNLLLHVDGRRGIELVVPWHVAFAEAEAFLHERHDWLRGHLEFYERQAKVQPRRRLVSGEAVPLLGDLLTLTISREPDRRRSRIIQSERELHVLLSPAAASRPALERWYRAQARHYFAETTAAFADQLGLRVDHIVIGDFRSQWGSCSKHRRRLAFNWRLLLGPEAVARYVAAHEVAHLRYPNHSKRFWGLVARAMPDYREAQRWLRQHSNKLQL